MAFAFKRDETAGSGIRRIAHRELDRALAELADGSLDTDGTVHQVRKRCKKLRAVLRLARGELERSGVYKRENAAIRDAGRLLSDIRDAQALSETLDELLETFSSQANLQRMGPVRRALEARRDEMASEHIDLDARLEDVAGQLRAVRERVDDWPVGDGFDALAPGLKATYERARKAMRAAQAKPSTANLHEWRKRVKYHRYHLRMMQPLWKGPLKAWKQELHELSELLGDDHDLAVLGHTLSSERERFPSKRDLQALLGLADRRRAQLQSKAFPLGARLSADKPRHLLRRLEVCWHAARAPAESASSKLEAEVLTPADR